MPLDSPHRNPFEYCTMVSVTPLSGSLGGIVVTTYYFNKILIQGDIIVYNIISNSQTIDIYKVYN